jgi:putative FmdB family regulatory protein
MLQPASLKGNVGRFVNNFTPGSVCQSRYPAGGPYNPPDMPVYEYACTSCGERTEARQGFDDAPLEKCPVCGGALRKLYSPVGIVFKGSGFYSTDAKKKPKEPAPAKDGTKGEKKKTGESKPSSTEKSA